MEFARVGLWFGWGAFLLCLFSCKPKDEIPPTVIINYPAEGSIYNVFDTVVTTFQLTDETQLISATAEIVDENFIPITPETTLEATSQSAEFVLTDKLLETGDYYVLVTAFDGTNETRAFRKIKIIALPKERKAIYVATSSGSGQDQVQFVDSLLQNSVVWVSPGQDVFQLCINSKYDQLSLVGRYNPGLITYNLLSESILWQDNAFGASQVPRFTNVYCYESSVYASFYDRELRGYNLGGSLTFNLATGNFVPETVFRTGNYLLIENNLVGDERFFMDVYSAQTNAFLRQREFDIDIVSICTLDDELVLLFGNDGNQARVFQYEVASDSWWEPRQLPAGKLIKAVGLEAGNFAIAHENGLYFYTYSPNYLNQLNAQKYNDLAYDVGRNTIVAAHSNMLEELTVVGQPVGMIALSDSIVSFDIHYTR